MCRVLPCVAVCCMMWDMMSRTHAAYTCVHTHVYTYVLYLKRGTSYCTSYHTSCLTRAHWLTHARIHFVYACVYTNSVVRNNDCSRTVMYSRTIYTNNTSYTLVYTRTVHEQYTNSCVYTNNYIYNWITCLHCMLAYSIKHILYEHVHTVTLYTCHTEHTTMCITVCASHTVLLHRNGAAQE